jgi:hypothetical protein
MRILTGGKGSDSHSSLAVRLGGGQVASAVSPHHANAEKRRCTHSGNASVIVVVGGGGCWWLLVFVGVCWWLLVVVVVVVVVCVCV